MEFFAKKFNSLTNSQLYEILKARAKVFVAEQKIIYVDADDKDYNSLHCFFTEDGIVTAYLRAFSEKDGVATVGRVLTICHGKGLGRKLMEQSMPEIKRCFGCKKITLHAQKHAEGFYKKLGFEVTSDEFLEEGIVHVTMEKDL